MQMNSIIKGTLAAALLLTTAVRANEPVAEDAGKWRPLFNGQNLHGWQVQCLPADGDKKFWFVEDGAIVCNSIGQKDHDYVWLMTTDEFSDFEIKLKFQAFRDSPGNSGLQVRSRYDDSPDAPHGGWLDGPQIDIHPSAPWRIGKIYDETREERRWIYPSLKDWRIDESYAPEQVRFFYSDEGDGWNSLFVRCEGNRIRVELNGLLMTDYDGTGVLDNEAHRLRNVGRKGHIALQLHSKDELRMRFKDIMLKALD